MLIGILGAGEVALAFSRYALRAGHQVRLSNSSKARWPGSTWPRSMIERSR